MLRRTAVGMTQGIELASHLLAESPFIERAPSQPPGFERNIGHGKVFLQAADQGLTRLIRPACCSQGGGQAMHLGADVVVFLAKADQFGKLLFKQANLVAQGMELALGERDGLAPMLRMRHRELGEELVVLSEKIRVVAQIARNVIGIHVHLSGQA